MAYPTFENIHHLKFAVADLGTSLTFYERAIGARRKAELDHVRDGAVFAYILEVPNLGTELELRLDAASAERQSGFDPITFTVADRAILEAWQAHFEANGIAHSGLLIGMVGWLVVFEDPDGRRLRLYTRETHGPEVSPTRDSTWL